ncbi:ectonucleoside triphosphate diphosphohydrolase 8-like [Ptychodera flava]|uniref:ectonucleoside triphosphate diphosphohydrolase 8-like n=1 Tax=Ptychodera flava TaxID=63121 RepID=UPI00396A2D13
MLITVHAVINGKTTRVPVEVEPQDSVESLIIAFCVQQGCSTDAVYVLRNEKEDILDPSRSLALCGIEENDTVYLTEGDNPVEYVPSPQMPLSYNPFMIVGMVLVITGIIGIVVVVTIQQTVPPEMEHGYGLVWDAGSTHSKLHIYEWPVVKEDTTALVAQKDMCRAQGGGISNYTDNPSGAGKSLESCMDSKAMTVIPEGERNESLLMLGATAGMRLVEKENESVSNAILSSVHTTLDSYPFKVLNVSIISGEQEGSYSWVTVNYLLGNFAKGPATLFSSFLSAPVKYTVGALDMGGASLQITFVPENPSVVPKENTRYLKLYGDGYTVYTHSYLCYGIREAERRFLANLAKNSNGSHTVTNPCAPSGHSENRSAEYLFDAYCSKGLQAVKAWGSEVTLPAALDNNASSLYFTIEGSSDPKGCAEEVTKLFNTSTFKEAFKAPVHGKYFAFSTFYYTTHFLNLSHDASLTDFNSTMNDFCTKTWDQVKVMPTEQKSLLAAYCFQAKFIFAFLTDPNSYHFTEDTWDFEFANDVAGSALGWSLGFMINTTNVIPTDYEPSMTKPIPTSAYYVLLILFAVIIAVGLSFVLYACVRSKPRFSRYRSISRYGAV